jgi:RNA polymerase sigma-70 factor (ECF subfamily)
MAQRANKDKPEARPRPRVGAPSEPDASASPEGDPKRVEQDAASARRAELDALIIDRIRATKSAVDRQAAWAELLQAHEDRIFATCLKMVRDYETARDLTQDAMVKVIQGLDSFDNRARFSTWLTRVSMNVCISYMRKRKLRRHASLDAPMGGEGAETRGRSFSDALEATPEPSGQDRVEQREDRDMLLAALDTLDPDHRAVLVLRDGQDLDYQQIGDVLGVPIGTVKSRLFRARAALREAIEKQQSSLADEYRTEPDESDE